MPAKHHGADKHRESPEHVHRLRTAVAIGREQRSQWPELQRALSAATAKSCAGTHPVVDLGIITAPFNVDRRRRVRRARDVPLTRRDAVVRAQQQQVVVLLLLVGLGEIDAGLSLLEETSTAARRVFGPGHESVRHFDEGLETARNLSELSDRDRDLVIARARLDS